MFGLGNLTGLLSQDMAIDLGTANTLVYVKGRALFSLNLRLSPIMSKTVSNASWLWGKTPN